jgi:23S rRNA-/tRNA-specific pseudouridylate synthase
LCETVRYLILRHFQVFDPYFNIRAYDLENAFLIHRLDAATSGVIAIALTKSASNHFFHLLQYGDEERVYKMYKTLTTSVVPLGSMVHFHKKRGMMPQLISTEPVATDKEWRISKLHVNSCELSTSTSCTHQIYESCVQLCHGRKHQIRAQLAAVGAPIVNDTIYEPLKGLTLQSFDNDMEKMSLDPRFQHGVSPTSPIGLHAYRLRFSDISGEVIDISCDPPWRH